MNGRQTQRGMLDGLDSSSNQAAKQKLREIATREQLPALAGGDLAPQKVVSQCASVHAGSGSLAQADDTRGISYNSEDDTRGILSINTHRFNHVCQFPEYSTTCVNSETPQPYVSTLDDDVLLVIRKHLATGPKWWLPLFKIRRELDPIAQSRSWDNDDWRSVVAFWLKASNGRGVDVPGFDSAFCEFKKKLAITIKVPLGSVFDGVKARRAGVAIPDELVGTKLEAVARTMIAYHEEHSERGRETFYAPLRKIADLSGITGDNRGRAAQSLLGALQVKGYVSLLLAGTEGVKRGGKANTWQWHDPPCPGQASWNSNKVLRERHVAITSEADSPSGTNPSPPSPTLPTADANAFRQPEDGDWSFLATDDDSNESFHELAAKFEFDGGLTRADAEQKALLKLKLAAQ
jgi:hypothetical protein